MELSENKKYLKFSEDKELIHYKNSDKFKLNEVLDETKFLYYTYNYKENWEIIIKVLKKIDTPKDTAFITDYRGRYNPADDIGGMKTLDKLLHH